MDTHGAVIIGAACLVRSQGRLVLEVQKQAKWRQDAAGELHIALGCVGGKLEPGETAVEALQREAIEEMGCGIALQEAALTYAVRPDCQVEVECWEQPGIRPAFTWEACLPGLLPGKKVAVFRGQALGEPVPGDLPALLCIPPEMLLSIGRGGMRLAQALASGASLLTRVALPQDAWLELAGTPAVLSLLERRGEDAVKVLLGEG